MYVFVRNLTYLFINYMSLGASSFHVLMTCDKCITDHFVLELLHRTSQIFNSHLYFPKIDIHYLISIRTLILTLHSVVTLINI